MKKHTILICLGLIIALDAVAAFANWPESPVLAIVDGTLACLLSFIAGRISKS